jgi:hypothetical protein
VALTAVIDYLPFVPAEEGHHSKGGVKTAITSLHLAELRKNVTLDNIILSDF